MRVRSRARSPRKHLTYLVRTSYRKPLDYGMKASQLKTSGPTLKSKVNVNLHVTRKKVPQLFGELSFSVP